LILALTIGIGAAAINALANLFVVEKYPRAEWEDRVSWLQGCYNTGMLGGMLLAGATAEGHLRLGLLAAGALTAVATLLASVTVPALPPVSRRGAGRDSPTGSGYSRVHVPRLHLPHFDWDHGSPYAVLVGPTGAALRRLKSYARRPFTLLQLTWLMTNTSAGILYALYPLLMLQVFDIPPGPAAAGLALATGLSTGLYAPSGQWSHRFGPERVMQAAVATRAVSLLALVGLAAFPAGQPDWFGLLAFAGVVLAWPPLSISSTMVTSILSASGEGEGLGIYTAVRALGSLLGAIVGGWTAHHLGYDVALHVALLVGILAVLLSLPLGALGVRNASPMSAANGSS